MLREPLAKTHHLRPNIKRPLGTNCLSYTLMTRAWKYREQI